MEHIIGHDYAALNANAQEKDVTYDTRGLINPHILLLGQSGAGKSHQLLRMIESAEAQGVEVDIFDVHNELDTRSSTNVIFSPETRFGINPFVIDTTPHAGGVQRSISKFCALMRRASVGLGDRQLDVLSNLIEDVYRASGIYETDKSTWYRDHIDERTRNQLLKDRQYDKLRNFYPVLDDIIQYGERKLTTMKTGGNNDAVRALEELNRAAQALSKASSRRSGNDIEKKEANEAELEKAKTKAIEKYTKFINSIQTGAEMKNVYRYDSAATLQSVISRLSVIRRSGIFHPNLPPFGRAKIRCHQIKFLSIEEQRLYVYVTLEESFRRRVNEGKKNKLVHVAVIDEANRFFTDDSDNPLNMIAKEGRKFGFGLWAASQNPGHISEDFITSCATVVNLGLNSIFRSFALNKLQTPENVLDRIASRSVAAVRFQQQNGTPKWESIYVL